MSLWIIVNVKIIIKEHAPNSPVPTQPNNSILNPQKHMPILMSQHVYTKHGHRLRMMKNIHTYRIGCTTIPQYDGASFSELEHALTSGLNSKSIKGMRAHNSDA